MSGHLKLVGPKPPKPPRRRKGQRYDHELLSEEEQKRAKAAFRNMKDAFGS